MLNNNVKSKEKRQCFMQKKFFIRRNNFIKKYISYYFTDDSNVRQNIKVKKMENIALFFIALQFSINPIIKQKDKLPSVHCLRINSAFENIY